MRFIVEFSTQLWSQDTKGFSTVRFSIGHRHSWSAWLERRVKEGEAWPLRELETRKWDSSIYKPGACCLYSTDRKDQVFDTPS